MPTARQVPPDLKKYMAKRVSVKMNGHRIVQGRLSGFDLFMNLVLEDAEEIISGSTERLEVGVMIVRGNSVLQMECLDPV
jgi:small nuclear ribonucleoprotein G